MRILVLSADYAPDAWSGIGTAVAVQAAAVARQGAGVEVVLPAGHSTWQRSPAVRVRTLTPERFPVKPSDFDVLHLHSLALSELALQIRSRFGLPLVYSAHATVAAELPGYGRWSGWAAVQDLVLAHSDHVLFPSIAERAAAVRRHANLDEQSSVLPNGLPEPLTHARRVARGPIVFAGRFAESKGLRLLRAIVERLDGQPGIRFVLAGGHGDADGLRIVDELVSRHPDRCRATAWLGPEALERLFTEASMVLVPSRYEPFGMVALEAMRAGAPVLAAPVGGLCDVVGGAGAGGILMHSRRPEDWCEAILGLWRSPKLRRTLGCQGPRYVAEHYDADVLARSLVEDVYLPLTQRGAGRTLPLLASGMP